MKHLGSGRMERAALRDAFRRAVLKIIIRYHRCRPSGRHRRPSLPLLPACTEKIQRSNRLPQQQSNTDLFATTSEFDVIAAIFRFIQLDRLCPKYKK